jgi:hypothetical protein
MVSASTNIQQGDTQDDVFNCETQEDCGENGGTNGSRHKKLHPSMQMARECQCLLKTNERNLKQGYH